MPAWRSACTRGWCSRPRSSRGRDLRTDRLPHSRDRGAGAAAVKRYAGLPATDAAGDVRVPAVGGCEVSLTIPPNGYGKPELASSRSRIDIVLMIPTARQLTVWSRPRPERSVRTSLPADPSDRIGEWGNPYYRSRQTRSGSRQCWPSTVLRRVQSMARNAPRGCPRGPWLYTSVPSQGHGGRRPSPPRDRVPHLAANPAAFPPIEADCLAGAVPFSRFAGAPQPRTAIGRGCRSASCGKWMTSGGSPGCSGTRAPAKESR